MAPVPEVLQRRFNLPSELGSRAVPRVFHAFRGERPTDKATFQNMYYPAVMAGALPQERHKKMKLRIRGVEQAVPVVKRVTQAELAGRGGLNWRPSYTRRISQFAPIVESERRKHDRKPLVMVERRRKFAAANRMALYQLPERQEDWAVVETKTGRQVRRFMSQQRAQKYCAERISETAKPHQVEAVPLDTTNYYHAPSLDQVRQDERTAAWWDPDFDAEGFRVIDCWIWDERVKDPDNPNKSLDATSRRVMTAYKHLGLLEKFPGKPAGILRSYQETAAKYAGCSVRSVYRANQKWAKLGVLRIAHEREQKDGEWVSGPQIVIYLPMRQFTEAEAARERERLQARASEIVKREGVLRQEMLARAAQLHQELLEAWKGQEHSLAAFWNEIYRRLVAAAIDNDLITHLVPSQPRPPE